MNKHYAEPGSMATNAAGAGAMATDAAGGSAMATYAVEAMCAAKANEPNKTKKPIGVEASRVQLHRTTRDNAQLAAARGAGASLVMADDGVDEDIDDGEDAPRDDTLTRHLRTLHAGNRLYVCDTCHCTFACSDTLTRHSCDAGLRNGGRKIKRRRCIPMDGNEIAYLADRIMDHRVAVRGGYDYLVRWDGFSPEFDSWEPAANILTPDLISQYWGLDTKTLFE